MKIYVAGHTGMLGSAIVRGLLARGYTESEILTYTHDQWDLKYSYEQFWERSRVDYCFMAAGLVGGIRANMENQAQFLSENTRMAFTIVDVCAQYKIPLCYVGSSCMYPVGHSDPITEDMLGTGAYEPTNEGYALAKTVGMRYAQWMLPDSVIGIPCNLYGPNDHYDPERSHVFPALIQRFVDAMDSGAETVTVWGSGSPKREFLHVDDCASALIKLMQEGARGVYNIGANWDYPIGYLAQMIADEAGYKGKIIFDQSKPDGIFRKKISSQKIYDAYGWQPQIGLRKGIQLTIEEYRKIKSKDEWYSTDGKHWKNDARPNQPIESDSHANLTGQVIKDKDGNIIARARKM